MGGDLKINKQICQVVVSALKNKAGKATECEHVGSDDTLQGLVREGLEQRAERSEGVSHVDNWGEGASKQNIKSQGPKVGVCLA